MLCFILSLLSFPLESHTNDAVIDNEDFPALPTRRPAAPPELSRVSSLHNSVDLGARSSTPKLPPGLNISHAHPSPPEKKEAPIISDMAKSAVLTSIPVIPAVPLLPMGQQTGTPKPKDTDRDENAEQVSKIEAANTTAELKTDITTSGKDIINLGSPKPRKSQPKTEAKPDAADEIVSVDATVVEGDEKAEMKDNQDEPQLNTKRPGKLDIPVPPANMVSQTSQPEAKAPAIASDIVETPSAISSQPGTPATAASETPSRAAARPRTLRVVTGLTKQADATPASAATERSVGMPPPSLDKTLSRRPSVSSISHTRSSTPAMSEAFSFGASRASSPPPGIVGSAPERAKTKAQQRKERKEKSKQTTESEHASGTTTPVVEEVAPVISRQRKQKKRVESKIVGDSASQVSDEPKTVPASKEKESSPALAKIEVAEKPAKAPAKPKRTDSKKSSAPPTPKEPESKPSPLISEPPPPVWTLRDLYNHMAKHPDADMQTLLNTHVSSMPEILASLTSTKDIEFGNPLFNPPPLSSYRLPTDTRRGADYLDANGYTDSNPFGMLYLTQDKKRAIQNGHAVRISDASKPNDLLRRAMVSPTGTVWRHLTQAEEERVLELEERREVYAEEWGAMGLGLMDKLTVLEEDDYMNLEGGMEKLSRNGEAHGVSWVMRDDEQDEEDAEANHDDELEYDEEDEDVTDDDDLGLNVNVPGGWETGRALGTVPENMHITNSANVLPPMRLQPGLEGKPNLKIMDVDKLMKRMAEVQKEAEAARKEVDRFEKNVLKKTKEATKWRETALKVTA